MVKENLSKLSICLLALILLISIPAAGFNTAEDHDISSHSNSDYTTHQPIKIDNNTDLTTTAKEEGWRGEGTEQDPYIIDNYSIDGEEKGYCIQIADTNKHFMIKNCYLYNATYREYNDPNEDTALELDNVTNGEISNCTFLNNEYTIKMDETSCDFIDNDIVNSGHAFRIVDSDSNNFIDNRISDCHYSINLMNSGSNKFVNNSIKNAHKAIQIENSRCTILKENNVSKNEFLINLYRSDLTHIVDNTFYDNERGVDIDRSNKIGILNNMISNTSDTVIDIAHSNQNTIKDNTIDKAIGDCIILLGSDNNTLQNNKISNTEDPPVPFTVPEGSAIYIYNSNDNIFSSNTATDNKWGIYIGKSKNNLIENNTIRSCEFAGIKIWGEYQNNVIHNSISANDGSGIIIKHMSDIKIRHNEIFNNDEDAMKIRHVDDSIISFNQISNNHVGLSIARSEDNTLSGNMIDKNNYGMDIINCEDMVLTDNQVKQSEYSCVELIRSTQIKFENNNFENGSLFFSGDKLKYWNSHIISTSNTVNGQPIYYWKDRVNDDVPNDAGEVILVNCSDINVEDQKINDGSFGILLGFSDNNHINNNELTDNGDGIYLYQSDSNRIENNRIEDSIDNNIILTGSENNLIIDNNISNDANLYGINGGIYLKDSHNTTIKNCIIKNNDEGIAIENSNHSLIKSNEISSNIFSGIYARICKNNTIIKNTVILTEDKGIYFGPNTENNSIYMNNFIDNRDDPKDKGNNNWDNGDKGNYWSDYDEPYPCASELRFSDTWDTTIDIKGGKNQDNHPLVEPVGDMDEEMESSCIYLMSFMIIVIMVVSIVIYRKIKNTE